MAVTSKYQYTTDLSQGVRVTPLGQLLFTGDKNGDTFSVRVLNDGQPADLTGAAVNAYIMRADHATIPLTGVVQNDCAMVTLDSECYAVPGRMMIVIKLGTNNVLHTIFAGEGAVVRSSTDSIIDSSNVIPSLEDLLAQIDAMEQATATANEAAVSANTAAQSAQTAAQQAQTAASMAEPWASATATAESLPTGSAPTVAVTDTDTGRAIVFGIPRGEKGEKGEKGDPGNGSATTITVNGIEPSGDNITLTAADVGALPATIEGVTEPMLIITDASGNIIASTTFGGNLTINGTLTANRVVGAVYA